MTRPIGDTRPNSTRSRQEFLTTAAMVGTGLLAGTMPASAEDDTTETDEGPESLEGGTNTEAGARIVHLSPDAPVVDVYVDRELWFEDVEPFATQTEYLEYVPGTYTVQFTPAGEGPEAAVLESEVSFQDGRYTVAAVGEACAVSDEPLRIVTLEDDTISTSPGHARVRGVHASVDAPRVDFTVRDGEGTVFENLGFGEGDYGEVSADEEVIEIRESETGEVVDRFGIGFEAGGVYIVFALGYVDPENAPENAVGNASFRSESPKTRHRVNGEPMVPLVGEMARSRAYLL